MDTLEEAITKAISNGWDCPETIRRSYYDECSRKWIEDYNDPTDPLHVETDLNTIIYNHEFAKALWGEEPEYTLEHKSDITQPDARFTMMHDHDTMRQTYRLSSWQYHLQQMVISPDPIEYLKDNM